VVVDVCSTNVRIVVSPGLAGPDEAVEQALAPLSYQNLIHSTHLTADTVTEENFEDLCTDWAELADLCTFWLPGDLHEIFPTADHLRKVLEPSAHNGKTCKAMLPSSNPEERQKAEVAFRAVLQLSLQTTVPEKLTEQLSADAAEFSQRARVTEAPAQDPPGPQLSQLRQGFPAVRARSAVLPATAFLPAPATAFALRGVATVCSRLGTRRLLTHAPGSTRTPLFAPYMRLHAYSTRRLADTLAPCRVRAYDRRGARGAARRLRHGGSAAVRAARLLGRIRRVRVCAQQ
jgi:hypothetical protein